MTRGLVRARYAFNLREVPMLPRAGEALTGVSVVLTAAVTLFYALGFSQRMSSRLSKANTGARTAGGLQISYRGRKRTDVRKIRQCFRIFTAPGGNRDSYKGISVQLVGFPEFHDTFGAKLLSRTAHVDHPGNRILGYPWVWMRDQRFNGERLVDTLQRAPSCASCVPCPYACRQHREGLGFRATFGRARTVMDRSGQEGC